MPLLEPLNPSKQLLADKAYDSEDLRAWLNKRKTKTGIPQQEELQETISVHKTPLPPAQQDRTDVLPPQGRKAHRHTVR